MGNFLYISFLRKNLCFTPFCAWGSRAEKGNDGGRNGVVCGNVGLDMVRKSAISL